MEDIIHLLPDSVANQIAAGEVVQRPSSIVKEMVENSIDAGAKNIQVLVVDGGKTSVQVIDDGKGMSETDARLAFERHATSKISQASDLFTLSTMGFRGEALASIAAVAQVELKTRREEDELGTYIQISGSHVDNQEPTACPVGSNFSVKNLFFNVPARRKFLKANQTELNNVIADFERVVLVHPQVSFTLYSNGLEVYNLPETNLRQRIMNVFGKKLNSDLLPIEVETSLANITGYVAKPETAKKKGNHQYFFVNGRYMRHPYFHSAVMRAYEGMIPAGEHISYFIYFDVSPSDIDVNVHPTKTEIKFDNEQAIWQVLSASVREALGKFCSAPLIDFDVEGRPDIPAMGASKVIPQQPKPAHTSYNPFATTVPKPVSGWENLYKSEGGADEVSFENLIPSEITGTSNADLNQSTLDIWKADELDTMSKSDADSIPKFQYKGRYIIYPDANGLIAVDQHRAHIRVLYEQNMQCLSDHPRPSQKQLFPDIIQFSKAESLTLDGFIDDLHSLGFELTNLGGGSYSVEGVPIELQGLNIDRLLHEIVGSLMAHSNMSEAREAWETISLIMAREAAVVYGQVLSEVEMDQLLTDLFATSSPARTPDGKVIYATIDYRQIDKLF